MYLHLNSKLGLWPQATPGLWPQATPGLWPQATPRYEQENASHQSLYQDTLY